MRLTSLALCLLFLAGCATNNHATNVHDIVPAISNSFEKAKAHTLSASRLVEAVKMEATDYGKRLVALVQGELALTYTAVSDGQKQAKTAEDERIKIEQKYATLDAKLTEATSTIGYRIEVWVKRASLLFLFLSAVHYVGMPASLLIPPPAGIIVNRVATWINPLGWIQAAVSHVHAKRAVAAATA